MTARTHDLIAFASLLTVAVFFPPGNMNVLTLVGAVLATDMGALIPDMDGGGNRLWHLLPAGEKTGRVLRRVFYRHRTITHSLIGVFLIYKFFSWLLPKFLNSGFLNTDIILVALMIGYLSHLIADSFTEEGIPLLFPINLNFGIPPIRSWRIKTGKWFENFVIYPAIWVYLIWFINAKREILVSVLKSISA
jgi:inner membrane protein